jgi:hypothetical protein
MMWQTWLAGDRYVAATREQLADQTGLSVGQA